MKMITSSKAFYIIFLKRKKLSTSLILSNLTSYVLFLYLFFVSKGLERKKFQLYAVGESLQYTRVISESFELRKTASSIAVTDC